jgi:hypothetical protein
MLFDPKKKKTVLFTIIPLLTIAGLVSAQDKIIELKFAQPPVSDSDTSRTLQSLMKVQGTGQFCEDGLYLMTHFGDREDLFQKENQKTIDNPLIDQTWRHCSVFSTSGESGVIMGRNWDNQNVGSIVVSLYHPPDGYSSISFCRSIDLGFGHKDLEGIESSPFGNKLLLAPFYAMDGLNEHGVAVAVAANRATKVKRKSGKELVCITFLMRKILDQTKNIQEAVELAEKYIPFDIDQNSLTSHLMVGDASGRSVILEYDQDQWRKTYGDKSWQVLSTKPIFNVPDANLREQCWRYRSMSETLEKTKGDVDWKAGMKILQDVTQKGTTWSVAYALTSKDLYFSVYQNWGKIYHLKMFEIKEP